MTRQAVCPVASFTFPLASDKRRAQMVGEPPGLWCGFISQAGIERFLSEGFVGGGFQVPSSQGIYWSLPDAGGG
jgi:hypothetical protein